MPAPTVFGFTHWREEKILLGLHLNGCLIDLDMHKWAIFAILRALNLMIWWISAFKECKNSWKSNFRDSKCVKMAYFALLESPKLISRKIWVKFLGFSKKVPSWPHFNASTHSLRFYTAEEKIFLTFRPFQDKFFQVLAKKSQVDPTLMLASTVLRFYTLQRKHFWLLSQKPNFFTFWDSEHYI